VELRVRRQEQEATVRIDVLESGENFMKNVTTEKAQESLPRLLEEVGASHEPIQITGQTVSSSVNKIGNQYRKPCTYYLFRGCASLFVTG
jgi:hypothetical protein